MSQESDPPRAIVHHRRRWSSVWVVPAVALVVAGWLVWKNYHGMGPLIEIRFDTAESIEAGKTEVRCRSVRVGIVERIELSSDLRSVVAEIRIDRDAMDLLRRESRFWVVKPRITASSISGIGTLLSGAYIELEPGDGPAGARNFVGLEEPPVTSSTVPGLRLTLVAEDAGSLNSGSPIYYRGFEVGRVERRILDVDARRVRFDIFIDEDYAHLVRKGTCFWNTSGVDVTAGADGFKLSTPSVQAMLTGGASFAVPKGGTPGNPARTGDVFELYADATEARRSVFTPDHRCLVYFDQSVRGLSPGAPVEFRGIPIGRVREISFDHSPVGDSRVPVLIEINTETLGDAAEDIDGEDSQILAKAVRRGLRASLGTGSLLTGALFVDLDFASDPPPAELTRFGDFDVIPTESSGLARLQDKVNAVLAKLESLPLEETLTKFGSAADEISVTVREVRNTLAEAEGALAAARELLDRDETQNLAAELDATLKEVRSSVSSLGPEGAVQGDLARTLDELRSALRSFKSLSDTIEEKPSSLLFGRESSGDPIPRARR